MPRRNRVDPFGDLHAVAARGLFTGNRGCVVDDHENVVRHHGSQLWITCETRFRDWRWPLARPRRWTPLFFLDEAVALAAGHRPCAFCRRSAYLAYRDAVTRALSATRPLRANELDRRLRAECLQAGRGLVRAHQRKLWSADWNRLPAGVVVIDPAGHPQLVLAARLARFEFEGWVDAGPRPVRGQTRVLTPPTSVLALCADYRPVLHSSARPAAA